MIILVTKTTYLLVEGRKLLRSAVGGSVLMFALTSLGMKAFLLKG